MHIKRLHDMIETLTEIAKCELDKGIECVDTEEMGEVCEMISDLCKAEYHAKISKAMDEAEYGEDYDYMGAYDRKGYRGQHRDRMGRYMSRRGYEEPPYYHMTPDMYKEHDAEYWRDMDRKNGRMYYAEPSMPIMNGRMEQSRSERARKGYMETKEMGKDKQEKMKSLEEYMRELSSDLTEMISDASPEEKTMLKNKMSALMQKIQ